MYAVKGYAEFGWGMFGVQLGARYALFGLGGHVMFTGIFGAFLGFGMQTRKTALRILAPLIGLVLAIAARYAQQCAALRGAGRPPPASHRRSKRLRDRLLRRLRHGQRAAAHDLFAIPADHGSHRMEKRGVGRRVIREELADEIGRTISPEEYQDIVNDHMAGRAGSTAIHPRASAALVNAQHELAFRKNRIRNGGGDPERDPLVAEWRDDIRHLRRAVWGRVIRTAAPPSDRAAPHGRPDKRQRSDRQRSRRCGQEQRSTG